MQKHYSNENLENFEITLKIMIEVFNQDFQLNQLFIGNIITPSLKKSNNINGKLNN